MADKHLVQEAIKVFEITILNTLSKGTYEIKAFSKEDAISSAIEKFKNDVGCGCRVEDVRYVRSEVSKDISYKVDEA